MVGLGWVNPSKNSKELGSKNGKELGRFTVKERESGPQGVYSSD